MRLDKRNAVYGSALALVLGVISSLSCSSSPSAKVDAHQQVTTEVIKTKSADGDLPTSIKVKLTVSSPAQLKVKSGDALKSGAVLTDRADQRDALLNQRNILELSLEQLSRLKFGSEPENLPPIYFDEERARIKRAENLLATIGARIETQIKKLDAVRLLDLASSVISHEQSKLDALKLEAGNAAADIELGRGQLKAGAEKRAFVEFENRAKILREQSEARTKTTSAETDAAKIKLQIAEIDAELLTLAIVRAPFPAIVERVIWEGQSNNEISITLLLRLDNDSGSERAGK